MSNAAVPSLIEVYETIPIFVWLVIALPNLRGLLGGGGALRGLFA